MALVNILNVCCLDNPTAFTNPFQFEITFECIQPLTDDLEWKVVYVGNAEDASHDQVLEEVMVGPVTVGINRFVLQAAAPDPNLISNQDLIGVTVILVSCAYMDNKFVQIGYYVNNDYQEPVDPENLPSPVEIHKLFRSILAEEPRVTRYAIDWTGGGNIAPVVNDGTEEPALNNDDGENALEMEEEDDEDDDEDEDEDEEDGDAEVDLEDEEEGDEEEGEDNSAVPVMQNNYVNEFDGGQAEMMIMNGDSNSIDVERMMQGQ